MAKEKKNYNNSKAVAKNAPAGFALFVAWVGALVYFVGQVDGFWNIVLAFLKACVWPAFLVYELFKLVYG